MMRAYTEAERAALIEHLEMCLTDETFFDSVVDFNARQREANLIALAALTAEPEIEVEDGDVLSAIFPVGTSFYTTPPIAAPAAPEVRALQRCAAARDGECNHAQCPQLRDGEPENSGRHCPIDNWDEDDD